MTKRLAGLCLIHIGLFLTIVVSLCIGNELIRVDILEAQKSYVALMLFLAISITPLTLGLHLFFPLSGFTVRG